jgi:hypothetical protein
VRQAAPETAHFPSKPSAASLNEREPFGLLPPSNPVEAYYLAPDLDRLPSFLRAKG